MIKFTNACDGAYSSIDIRFNKACDNDCSFCIEKEGLDGLGKTDVPKLIETTINSKIDNVLILGGEPFLSIKNLKAYVLGIRPFVKTIFITTSIPKTIDLSNPDVHEIFKNLDGINVSVQSIDWRENNQILRASSHHNRHEVLFHILKDYADKVRINLNLTKGGIDSKDKLMEAIQFLKKLGAKNIKINELQDNPDLYVSYEKIMNLKLHSPFSGGCQHPVDIDPTVNAIVKRSCFMVQEPNYVSFLDVIKLIYKGFFHKTDKKFAVVYENGKESTYWEKH